MKSIFDMQKYKARNGILTPYLCIICVVVLFVAGFSILNTGFNAYQIDNNTTTTITNSGVYHLNFTLSSANITKLGGIIEIRNLSDIIVERIIVTDSGFVVSSGTFFGSYKVSYTGTTNSIHFGPILIYITDLGMVHDKTYFGINFIIIAVR